MEVLRTETKWSQTDYVLQNCIWFSCHPVANIYWAFQETQSPHALSYRQITINFPSVRRLSPCEINTHRTSSNFPILTSSNRQSVRQKYCFYPGFKSLTLLTLSHFFFFFFFFFFSFSYHTYNNCDFDIFQKVVFCLALYRSLHRRSKFANFYHDLMQNYFSYFRNYIPMHKMFYSSHWFSKKKKKKKRYCHFFP